VDLPNRRARPAALERGCGDGGRVFGGDHRAARSAPAPRAILCQVAREDRLLDKREWRSSALGLTRARRGLGPVTWRATAGAVALCAGVSVPLAAHHTRCAITRNGSFSLGAATGEALPTRTGQVLRGNRRGPPRPLRAPGQPGCPVARLPIPAIQRSIHSATVILPPLGSPDPPRRRVRSISWRYASASAAESKQAECRRPAASYHRAS